MDKTLRLSRCLRQATKRGSHIFLIGMIKSMVILLSETGKVEGEEGLNVGK